MGVFRQPNGKLEALLDSQKQDEVNSNVILSAGYKGEAEQRIKANVSIGQSKVWHLIHQAVQHVTPFQIDL